MLPKVENSDIDWERLQITVMKRKEALLAKGTTKRKSSESRGLSASLPLPRGDRAPFNAPNS